MPLPERSGTDGSGTHRRSRRRDRALPDRPRGRERVAAHDRGLRLRGQDLAQPPAIPYRAGRADRLAQVSPGHLEVATLAGEETARGQRPGQDRRILEPARERQPLVGLIDTLGGAHPHPQDSHVGERASAQRRVGMLGIEVAVRGVQQVQPFADAAPRQPQRLQRGRELQREPGIAVLAAPGKRGAQVVDLELDLGQTAPVVSTPRGVEHRGHRGVVVAVTSTHGIGLAGLLQFLGAVLARRVQQPVTRCAAGTVGHHQRLVDEQAELIEDLEMFDVSARGDRLRGVRSKPPTNTASRRNNTRSESVNSACDQSTEARKVCWRRTAVRAPPVNNRNRSCRPSRISASDNARTRAAASSIASGRPSRRAQISATAAASSLPTARSGRACRARSTNNSTASSASDNDGTRQLSSPGTPMGSRLVASKVSPGDAPRTATISAALASSRCSQVSNTTSSSRSATNPQSVSIVERPG